MSVSAEVEPVDQGGGSSYTPPEYTPWIPGSNSHPGSAFDPRMSGNYHTGNINTGIMDGGAFGFAGPNPKRVQGMTPLQIMAMDFLGGTGQFQGQGMPVYNEEMQAGGLATYNGLQTANDLATGYLNPFSQDAAQKYAQAYGSASGLASGWNPLRGNSAGMIGQGVNTAGQQVSANTDGVQADLAAAKQQFMASGAPMIQDQFSLMGLGRSGGAGQSMSDAWAKIAADQFNQSMGREENRLNRLTGAQMQGADLWRGLSQDQVQQQLQGTGLMDQIAGGTQSIGSDWDQRRIAGVGLQYQGGNQFANLGQMKQDSYNNILDKMMGYGEQARQIAQEEHDAQYNDYLRRQGLAENAIYAPFSGVQNTVGTITETSGGK